jgi:hypothetical protein
MIASPTAMPFFVPPKHSTSTPAFQVISAGSQSSAAQAWAKRAPSICSFSPSSRQVAAIASISAMV